MAEVVVRMPRLADTLVEGTIGEWLKAVGERVAAGEPLAVVETDKVTTDLPSPVEGMLLEHLVSAGETVAVDAPIARIGETRGEFAPRVEAAVTPPGPRPVATAAAPAPLTPMRRAIAAHMQQAVDTIPHGQTVMAVDLTDVVAWREGIKEPFRARERANLTFTVLFIFALAKAVARQLRNDEPVDLGVAVAMEGGLIVPVVRSASTRSPGELARTIADLASRARAGRLTPDDMHHAVMTLTNVGSFGNLTAAPIIPLGQLGILAPGTVEQRPVLNGDGGIRPGWRCMLSLSFDRRALDDFTADRLLRAVTDELLDAPRQLGY
jgi:pyruvate/2-oxoglutarate dehydrogenase complex dihydrolipoamide acyltransferase (E2) component